jgi:hypothetical protein
MKAKAQGTAPNPGSHKMPTSPRRPNDAKSPGGDVEMTELEANEAVDPDDDDDDDDDGDAPLLARMRNQDAIDVDVEQQPQVSPSAQDGVIDESANQKNGDQKALDLLLEKDSKIPYDKLRTLCLVWLMLFALNCMRGNKKVPSFIGIANCSYAWMGMNILIYVFLIGVSGLQVQ